MDTSGIEIRNMGQLGHNLNKFTLRMIISGQNSFKQDLFFVPFYGGLHLILPPNFQHSPRLHL